MFAFCLSGNAYKISTHMKQPLIIPNFLTSEQCKKFIDCITKEDNWIVHDDNPNNIWNNRTKMPGQQVTDAEILKELKVISDRVKIELEKYFETASPVYAEMPHFVRWRPSDHLWPPHADKEETNGTPHPYPWRDFGAIIYLNDNFEGGEIEYPNFNLRPTISAGTLAAHPGTLDYLHGVHPIKSGIRYTIASFLTLDKTYGYYDQ